MKTSLGIVLITAMLLFGASCQSTTAQPPAPAAQGQAGPPGQTGEQGQTGQTGNTGQTGDTGRKGDTGDRGKAAPCPAGQHRQRNPDTGKSECVSD